MQNVTRTEPPEPSVTHRIAREQKSTRPDPAPAECDVLHRDRAIAEIAARQLGLVTKADLTAAGITRGAVARRIAAGRLRPLYRDGFAYHSTRQAFERDRRKDADLQARGLRTTRLTYRQIAGEPHATIALLATALSMPEVHA